MSRADKSSSDLQAYAYPGNGSEAGWVLLRAEEMSGGHCIFKHLGSTLLHIESVELNRRLCQRMTEAGCEILEHPPQVEVKVERLDPQRTGRAPLSVILASHSPASFALHG